MRRRVGGWVGEWMDGMDGYMDGCIRTGKKN